MCDKPSSVSAVSMFKSTNVYTVKPEAEEPQNEEQKKEQNKPFINSVFISAYMH